MNYKLLISFLIWFCFVIYVDEIFVECDLNFIFECLGKKFFIRLLRIFGFLVFDFLFIGYYVYRKIYIYCIVLFRSIWWIYRYWGKLYGIYWAGVGVYGGFFGVIFICIFCF